MPLIIGNWKMNGNVSTIDSYFKTPFSPNAQVVICPPFPLLKACLDAAASQLNVKIGAQDCHWMESGAHTGETSPKLLADLGVSWVILGHSERRSMGNCDCGTTAISQKVAAALRVGLSVVLCVGEDRQQKCAGSTIKVVQEQVTEGLRGIQLGDRERIVVAYEPVWAIGTGEVADAEEVKGIVGVIIEIAGWDVRVIYGGSCTVENVGLFKAVGVEGLLVGGASLESSIFSAIVTKMSH